MKYDILYTPSHNILTDTGFAVACAMVLRIMEDGLLYVGLPCASYCWLSCSRHKRTRSRPLGNTSLRWVADHNKIGFRVGLLLMVALVRKIHVMLEHPAGSALPHVPWLQNLTSINQKDFLQWQWSQTKWFMGAFGSWTPKPSIGISTVPYLSTLAVLGGKINKAVRKAQQLLNQKVLQFKIIISQGFWGSQL